MAPRKSKTLPRYLKPSVGDVYALSKASSRGKKELLRHIPDHSVEAICQCASDLLLKRLPLNKKGCQKLQPHKRQILELLQRDKSVGQRRRILQRGGFVGALVTALMSAVPAIVSLIKK